MSINEINKINKKTKELIAEMIEEIEEIEKTNKKINTDEKDNQPELVPIEQFRIVFSHELFDKNGERHLLEEPLIVCCTSMRSNYSRVEWTLNELMDRMRFEVIKRYARVSET